MSHITIKYLAKELNLSPAAISKALRDSHEISDATKKRVRDLADKLNYIPNPYAGSLRHRKSKTIAVVLPEVADSFFSEAINGIESIAIAKNYHVLLYLTHESLQREEVILKEFQSGRVDGILMSISAETSSAHHIQSLISKEMPVVLFDRIDDGVETTKITTDDYESGYKAADHLIKSGCKRICFLSISETLAITRKRKKGCDQAIKDHGLMPSMCDVLVNAKEKNKTKEAIIQLLTQNNRPDGIIASVEKLSIEVYLACQELGLLIPDDLQVIGFSNLNSVSLLNPALTTITQPAFDMGVKAAMLLINSIEKRNNTLENELIIFPSEFNIRSSTK